jgi:hypothetical protein
MACTYSSAYYDIHAATAAGRMLACDARLLLLPLQSPTKTTLLQMLQHAGFCL